MPQVLITLLAMSLFGLLFLAVGSFRLNESIGPPEEVGAQIRQARREKGWGRRTLAWKTRISLDRLRKIENGKIPCTRFDLWFLKRVGIDLGH